MLRRPRDPHDESRRSILLTFIFSSAASTEASLKNGDDNRGKGSCKAVLLNDALCHVWEPVFCTPKKACSKAMSWDGRVGCIQMVPHDIYELICNLSTFHGVTHGK